MDSSSIFALIFVTAIIVGIIWFGQTQRNRTLQAERSQDAQILAGAQEEYQAFAASAIAGTLPDLSPQVGGVILKPGEKCFAIAHGVSQIVPRKQTRFVGGSHGVSIHIAKGVNYRVGAFRGHPISTTIESVGDTGNLYVTDQRVIFAGASRVTSLLINKVADARFDQNRVSVMAENKPPLVFQLSQKYRGGLLVAAIHVAADLGRQSAP